MVTLTDAQRGYIAGIIDGEGHISVNRYARRDTQKRLRPYGLKVNVRITQARRELLDYIHGIVGLESANINRTGKDNAYFILRFNHECLKWLLPQLKGHL